MDTTTRDTELLLLGAAALPVLVIFALVGIHSQGDFSWTYLSVPGAMVALFASAHLVVRRVAPSADPTLLPLALLLSGIGLAFITRLVPDKAINQVAWLTISIVALSFTLIVVRSLEDLGRYKYLLMIFGLSLMLLPALFGAEINGSKLWLSVGGLSIQPGEIARVFIILFLAAYLAENREMLSISTRRLGPIPYPAARTLFPLIAMWALSFVVMVSEKDLGSSLLLFGIFLVMIYAATGRLLYVTTGLILFSGGATAAYFMFSHVQTRVSIWLSPFADAAGKGYQLVQSLFAVSAGGLIGCGPGAGYPMRIPYVDTDFIFAAISEELGLLGASAVLILFLVFIYRGLSIALRAKSDMAAFTATGLVASIGLQVFVIVGGVTALIPLTGITVPFVSRGGSSMVSTFVLLALLMRAGSESTGLDSEMKTTSDTSGVLGRFALSKRLMKLSAIFTLLILLLVGNLTYLQVIKAPALAQHPSNTRGLIAEQHSARGTILTRDNVVLAESVLESNGTYTRHYPLGARAAHTLGYYSTTYGRNGLESSANNILSGHVSFNSWDDVLDNALGRPIRGNNLVTTLDSRIQVAAEEALGDSTGAAIVLDPRTGAVLASASTPAYSPEDVDKKWDTLSTEKGSPLVDRVRQSLTAPGSTFKVVTLTGAYAHDVATPSSQFKGPGSMEIGGAKVTNFEGGSYGLIDLQTATAKSINTVFAQLAVKLGAQNLVAQSEQFGFNRRVPYELPVKGSLMPNPTEMTTWETAWAGSGQPVGTHSSPAGPQATVFQMGLVAATIANDGKLVWPHIYDHIESPTGEILSITKKPSSWLTACSPEVAHQVTSAMIDVVDHGSGVGAKLSGVKIAGKTGTAEISKGLPTNAWFIAFAPADNPRIAVAIMIEGGGTGGRVAAPAAKELIRQALEVYP